MDAREENIRNHLLRMIPRMVAESQRFTEALAQQHQLHRTDMEALGVLGIAAAQERPITAGMLGSELRLSSGATTFVVDRLQRAGLAERVRNESDRREVLLQLSESGRHMIEQLTAHVLSQSYTVMDRFSCRELAVVERFLEAATEAMAALRDSLLPG